MGAGSTSQTNTTVTQTNIPKYAEPYVKNMLRRAESESERPYQPYGQQRIADQTPNSLNSYNMLSNLGASGLGGITNAMDIYGNVNNFASGIAGYASNPLTAQNVNAPQWNNAAAQQYMNPYLQNVLDVRKSQALLDFQRMQTTRNDQAIGADAFGGARHGVVDSLAQEMLMRQMSDIQSSGMNDAWSQALQAFGGDRNAALQAMQGNQQFGFQAQQQTEAQRQSGVNLGLSALAQQQAAAQGMVGAQNSYDVNTINRANAMSSAGDKDRMYQQSLMDVGYNDFVNQRDVERQNLQFLNSLIHGVPISGNQNVTEYQTINPVSQILGLGLGGLGLSQSQG